jgi:hypothetical protein
MKPNKFSPNADRKMAMAPKTVAAVDLNQSKTAFPPSSDAVARRAYSIYENQGSQPGHELKNWLEAEAQLFGGVERETQMHPGSSLFKAEH